MVRARLNAVLKNPPVHPQKPSRFASVPGENAPVRVVLPITAQPRARVIVAVIGRIPALSHNAF